MLADANHVIARFSPISEGIFYSMTDLATHRKQGKNKYITYKYNFILNFLL